ncbi:hypothetical protein [Mariniflexile sp.]|uniref:hypothetical protein n=1 Tax=Mariniflexile sp. TaxID=1979402 RepID=UPI004047F9D1
MIKNNIKIIKNSFLLGIVYAIGMAVFDYVDSESFNIWKFLFNLTFFGISMGLVNRNKFKEQSK